MFNIIYSVLTSKIVWNGFLLRVIHSLFISNIISIIIVIIILLILRCLFI